MFAKSRKEKYVGQAHDLAHDLTEAIAPHVERARDELAPRLADAREQLAPRLADARDQLAPRLADAREQLAPHVEDARGRLAKGVATATAAAAPVALEAKRRGELASAALKGESVKQKGGKKKLVLLLTGALALGVLAVQKMRGGESNNWQTSYTPSPAPATPPAPPAPSTGTHAADVATDAGQSGVAVGANPGEALSDSVGEPHAVTTPDDPAEDVTLTNVEDADKQS